MPKKVPRITVLPRDPQIYREINKQLNMLHDVIVKIVFASNDGVESK